MNREPLFTVYNGYDRVGFGADLADVMKVCEEACAEHGLSFGCVYNSYSEGCDSFALTFRYSTLYYETFFATRDDNLDYIEDPNTKYFI